MKLYRVAAAVTLPLLMSGLTFAQSNEQDRKDAHKQVKQQEKADKAQAKADHDTHEALHSHKVKKAAKAQDKADAEAAKANTPQ